MAKIHQILILLPILLLYIATSISGDQDQRPLATSASIVKRDVDTKCTCTTCQNPCGDYSSPPPPEVYAYPPPPEIYYYPPPSPVPLPPAIVYDSPPPPYTPEYPGTPYCPPPPVTPTICCGGSGGGGVGGGGGIGGGGGGYVPWYSPPGVLYPQDLGYHPNGATRGHMASWVGFIVSGLVCLWW